MLSLIDVKCPHCGAQGQLVLPTFCSIIIGPCPSCNEFVLVFCGHPLPLDSEIMRMDDDEEKRAHIMSVITDFLRVRVDKMNFDATEKKEEAEDLRDVSSDMPPDIEADLEPLEDLAPPVKEISKAEFDRFISIDLKLIDNPEYFRAVFE